MSDHEPGESVEVLVVGAGFGGLIMAHRLAQSGVDDVVILERDEGVGGTWRANHYPGAACDVPSHLYALRDAPNPDWSRTYATQPEILRYIEDCYDRFDVRRKVRTSTAVTAATWDETQERWLVDDEHGRRHRARSLVVAIGLFHTPAWPRITGLEDFEGTLIHSARWDAGHDVTGEDVAVIGTGATAIQVVPALAEQTRSLVVHQRTAPWIVPRVDEPYSAEDRARFASDPEAAQAVRDQIHSLYEANTSFLTGDGVGALLRDVALTHLEAQVPDDELRARLRPEDPIGCKRILVSSDFYPALGRDDVELVTDAIEAVTATGIRTADGRERPCDTIVLCTGFRATDYLRGLSVTGRGGLDLHQSWAGRPQAFHGISMEGFPNLFLLYGPNTNQGGNSILLMLESQADHVAAAEGCRRAHDAATIEVRPEAMARYRDERDEAMSHTVWLDGCDSYFLTGAGDVVTQLPHTAGWYATHAAFDGDDYELGSPEEEA